jgi:hypothetical protein
MHKVVFSRIFEIIELRRISGRFLQDHALSAFFNTTYFTDRAFLSKLTPRPFIFQAVRSCQIVSSRLIPR